MNACCLECRHGTLEPYVGYSERLCAGVRCALRHRVIDDGQARATHRHFCGTEISAQTDVGFVSDLFVACLDYSKKAASRGHRHCAHSFCTDFAPPVGLRDD
jgi:hypothetical protein